MVKKAALLASVFCIVPHSSDTTESGEFRDGGSALEVGTDISAERALALFERGACSNTEEAERDDFDLGAALKTAAEAEIKAREMREASDKALVDAITNGEVKTQKAIVSEGAAKILAAGNALEAGSAMPPIPDLTNQK